MCRLAIVALALLLSPAALTATLQEQRQAFRDALEAAERGDPQALEAQRDLLETYVLWPDLQATFLRATLSAARRDDASIDEFLEAHGTLRPARELRYHFALELGAEQRYAQYLEIYRQYYQGLGIAALDCLALQAEMAAGNAAKIGARVEHLWLVGTSQANECDPVFEYHKKTGRIDADLHRQRFELAIAARQFQLGRYLAKSIDETVSREAGQWLSAQRNPADFLAAHADRADSDLHRRQLIFAVKRLAIRDPAYAAELWEALQTAYLFSDDERAGAQKQIALWAARRHHADAYAALKRTPETAADTEVGRWLARTSLRARRWDDLIASIDAMPSAEQEAPEWRYWYAIALDRLGRAEETEPVLRALAAERGYYSFLAADELNEQYAFAHDSMAVNEPVIAALAARADIVRARELYFVGLEGRGRAEWDDATANLSADRKVQAALLAHRWGWHSRAIATAASAGAYDDLRIRFPLPYPDTFARHAKSARIAPSWAYGIARSESLFMRDIRSSAGAIGVMQLMPDTGRITAREIKVPYSGRVTLTDPDINIRLGTHYLGKMFTRFDNNRVLATAAYNAGPLNVEKWLPLDGELDARIWIENIPFNETRSYVRRVLETEVIFHWRLTGKVRRISRALPSIEAPTHAQKTAQID